MRKILAIFVIIAVWMSVIPIPAAQASTYGDIVISEIMYDPAEGGDPNEWVELYNPTGSAVDVSGWILTDDTLPLADEGQCVIPASTTIPSKGFLVVSKANLSVLLPSVATVQCTASGTYDLANTGDNLALINGSTSEVVFGSLDESPSRFFYPNIAPSNLGISIGLDNPTAGWSGTAADWALETKAPADPEPFTQHSAGAANSGWAGNITTPHDLSGSINGTVDTAAEWQAGELLGSADAVSFYLTWDAAYLYVGMVGGDATTASYNVLVDTDALDLGASNAGNLSVLYCGATFETNGKPDFALQVTPSTVNKNAASGSSWDSWTAPNSTAASNGAASGQAEFRISKSEMGITSASPVGLYLYVCNASGYVVAAWPPENKVDAAANVALSTRVYLPSTEATRSPRDDAAHLGYETMSGATTGYRVFFDDDGDPIGNTQQNWHARLNIQTAGAAGCEITIKVLANFQVSRLAGGARRAYEISPNASCTGLSAFVSLKYEDGTQAQDSDVTTPSELRSLNESALNLYRYPGSGTAWEACATINAAGCNRNVNHNRVVTNFAVTQFSTWSFGYTNHEPTVVAFHDFRSQAAAHPGLSLLIGCIVLTGGFVASMRKISSRKSSPVSLSDDRLTEDSPQETQ